MPLVLVRRSLTVFSGLLLLAGCAIPGSGSTVITRDAPPGAEIACIDTINNRIGKLGGVVITESRIEGNMAKVDLRTNEGMLFSCTSPKVFRIAPAKDLR